MRCRWATRSSQGVQEGLQRGRLVSGVPQGSLLAAEGQQLVAQRGRDETVADPHQLVGQSDPFRLGQEAVADAEALLEGPL